MNCAYDKERLTGYFDGELEAAEKADVERHIASCSECLRELGELKSSALLVKELPRLRAPTSIAEGISREIRSAGKVHSLAKFRRSLFLASGVAAAFFVVLNIVYFSQSSKDGGPVASRAPAEIVVAPMARMDAKQEAADRLEAPAERRAVAEQNKSAAPAPEARKNLADGAKKVEEKQEKAEDAVRAPAPVLAEAGREKAGGVPAPKPGAADEKATPTPAPAAAPVPPPAPAAPAGDKLVAKNDPAKPKPEPEPELKLKKASAPEAAAEPAPTHLTLASTQVAKARPQVEEALKKMGVALPAPAPATTKGPQQRARDGSEASFELVLTDAQIARLRQELEKQGTARLVVGSPEDPVLSQFRGGGLFGAAKRDSSGAAPTDPAPTAKKPAEAKEKDAEGGASAKAASADAPAGKDGETKRKIVLHLMEVKAFSDAQPAVESLKK